MKQIITWDEPKRQANIARHGLDFTDLTPDFFLASGVVPANEGRWKRHRPIGRWHHRGDFATLGTEALAVISMRPAGSKERKTHDKEI